MDCLAKFYSSNYFLSLEWVGIINRNDDSINRFKICVDLLQALQREDSYEETIRDLTQRLKDVSLFVCLSVSPCLFLSPYLVFLSLPIFVYL